MDSSLDAESAVEVRLNGKLRQIPPRLSVRALLEHLGLQPGLVVVERNREILSRDDYGGVTVEAGDTLELVHFVGGG